MTALQVIFLGVIQGLTEFLPISSSGHLVVAEHLLQIEIENQSMFVMNIIFHAGTLVALIIVYFRKWIYILFSPFKREKKGQRMLILLILASVPAGIAGILFEDIIVVHFSSVTSVSISFLFTAFVIWISEFLSKKETIINPTIKSSIWMGVAQAFALVPGLSRSGLTISAGRIAGMSREDALDFSFLMVCPVIAGATLLALLDMQSNNIYLPETGIIISGFLASIFTSLIAIVFLRSFVKRYSLSWFSLYLIIVAAILLLA